MTVIRAATAQDAEPIQHIYLMATGAELAGVQRWSDLITTACLFVAETSDGIIGFGGIDLNAVEQLKWIYVLPECQRSGIGSELLEQLENVARDDGLQSLRLHSAPNAAHFYRRHGYREVAPADQLEHDHDGVEMIKDLTV
jgi:ribosomal protein S18 acetylase RimI-like enzyme